MSTLNLLTSIVAYNDSTSGVINNNPKVRVGDINRSYFGLDVDSPQSQNFVIAPNSSLTLYDGSRSTSIDGTSTFSLTNTSGSTYRMYHSTGTAPGFRTARNISSTLDTSFNVTVNNNSVVSISQSGGPAVDFSAVTVGDVLYVGNNSLFNTYNQGYFSIIAKGSNYVQIQNDLAVAESNIALSTNYESNFLIYSSSGIQVGDTAVISSGFSPVTLGSYQVTAAAPNFFEFMSSAPLPIETSITTTATGLNFYSAAKFVTYVETDQSCYIRFDSDSTNVATIEPFSSDSGVLGMYLKTGYNYKAILTNRSAISSCNVYVFTAKKS
jgi:hypothetical protein